MNWLNQLKSAQINRSIKPVISREDEGNSPRPVQPYYLILFSALFLTAVGFILVYSALSVKALEQDGRFWAEILKPTVFTAIGLIGMVIASRLSLAWWRVLSYVVYAVALLLQISTIFFGKTIGGNRNWLDLRVITIQPSELLKLGFIMILATMFTYVQYEIRSGVGAVAYLTGICALTVGPVLLSRDLGSASIFIAIFVIMCFVSEVSWRYLFGFVLVGLFGASALVAISPSRRHRVVTFWESLFSSGPAKDGPATQTDHALWAIGNGGLTGQGPGASREKWRHLPTAESDYIFAILGEEYGFVGATLVLITFIVLIYYIFVVAMRHQKKWARVLCVGVGTWIAVQTIVNVGVVIGVFPVLGVPLPFISKGYSSLMSLLMGLGCVLSQARTLPGASAALRSNRGLAMRSASLLGRVSGKETK